MKHFELQLTPSGLQIAVCTGSLGPQKFRAMSTSCLSALLPASTFHRKLFCAFPCHLCLFRQTLRSFVHWRQSEYLNAFPDSLSQHLRPLSSPVTSRGHSQFLQSRGSTPQVLMERLVLAFGQDFSPAWLKYTPAVVDSNKRAPRISGGF